MYLTDTPPCLWRFVDTNVYTSKSDCCLLPKDVEQNSEIEVQSSKSDHGITGQALDSMGWLSKLVRARKEPARVVTVEDKCSSCTQGPTIIKTDAQSNSQIGLSAKYSVSSLPPKKRPRPVTQDNVVEPVPKKTRSGLTLIKAFPRYREEVDTRKYLGRPISQSIKKRKLVNLEIEEETPTKVRKIHQPYSNGKDTTIKGSDVHDDTDDDTDDDTLDAEVAMYMEGSGPPTVRAYRPMPQFYIPRLGAANKPSQSQADIEPALFQCTEECLHQFSSPLMINREPNKTAIHILNPWPCLYKNKRFGELKQVGGLEVEESPLHWKRPSSDEC